MVGWLSLAFPRLTPWSMVHVFVFQNKRKFATFYFPKLIIVGLIWMASVVMATWLVYNELRDPTYNYRLDTGNFFVSGSNLVIFVDSY